VNASIWSATATREFRPAPGEGLGDFFGHDADHVGGVAVGVDAGVEGGPGADSYAAASQVEGGEVVEAVPLGVVGDYAAGECGESLVRRGHGAGFLSSSGGSFPYSALAPQARHSTSRFGPPYLV
jgi:hypothetical protein